MRLSSDLDIVQLISKKLAKSSFFSFKRLENNLILLNTECSWLNMIIILLLLLLFTCICSVSLLWRSSVLICNSRKSILRFTFWISASCAISARFHRLSSFDWGVKNNRIVSVEPTLFVFLCDFVLWVVSRAVFDYFAVHHSVHNRSFSRFFFFKVCLIDSVV